MIQALIKPITIRLVILSIFTLAGVHFWQSVPAKNDDRRHRHLASVPSHGKILPAHFSKKELFHHTKKLISPISVSLHIIGEPPESPGDVYTLEARIQSRSALNQAEIEWQIPESSQLISGSNHASLYDLKAGEIKIVQLTLEQLTFENSQVHATAHGFIGDTRLTNAAQYNSLDQKDIEKSIEALQKRAAEDIKRSKLVR